LLKSTLPWQSLVATLLRFLRGKAGRITYLPAPAERRTSNAELRTQSER
jgi:hypothetical protein